MQAVLDGNTLITYHKTNDKVYNVEDIMSIPTSITFAGVKATQVAEEAELLLAA
jgi:hypothetical protein